jgi:hypothetical protein
MVRRVRLIPETYVVDERAVAEAIIRRSRDELMRRRRRSRVLEPEQSLHRRPVRP